jgi:environmental stress-induced protein Ves
MKLDLVVLALGVCLFSAGCGSGGKSTPPPPATYTIGGTVTGLTGTGLVLQDNGGNNLAVSASATTFAFTTAISSGSGYKVTVLAQPSSPVQSCVVTNGSGTASANVTTVSVACTTTTYTIGGTISGLAGTGLVLQDNGDNNLTVSASATTFAFTTALAPGAAYAVTVLTQPSTPTQNCVVTNGSGTANANVTSVSIACTTLYTIGGTITNLVGSGLVLQNNGLNNVAVPAGAGTFAFTTPIASGSAYSVTVLTQPTVPTQNCVVTGGSGTATSAATNISIACTTLTYNVSGTISGLVGTGLVLQDNGGNNLNVTANGPFAFTAGVGQGLPYSVTVSTQPTGPIQNCVVSNGGGTSSVNVTNVSITCTTTTYTIGGTVTGLTGSGLVLQDNLSNNLTVAADASTFTFTTALDAGVAYNVTALTQPSFPTQNCVVTDGGGTANANVTSVVVTCANLNEWTFEGGEQGPDNDDQPGVYPPTPGTTGSTYIPGARYWGASWSDTSGNFWLFGGYGYDSAGNNADINDLWEYNTTGTNAGEWTWVGGADVSGAKGIYPATVGTSGTTYMPGARDSSVSWTDASGNFWLFGGHGYDSTKTAGNLNDLWEYSTTGTNAGEWTWVSGSNVVNQSGIYPTTMGTSTTTSVPGARYNSVGWVDKNGNFWLFGGYGYDSTGAVDYLNDLWEYNTTGPNAGEWTWVNGSNGVDQDGAYGSKGVGVLSPETFPGSRYLATSWTDTDGNLWMFGGFGYDSVEAVGRTAVLGDLWEYNIGTGIWTWVGGSEDAAVQGTYGTMGMPASTNIPGSRKGAVAWTDSLGNFWLLGGVGFDSTNTSGQLNDLWEYTPNLTNLTAGEWTWQSGANTASQLGCYEIVPVTCPTIVPGSRGGSPNWIDSSGSLWLFGGNGPLSGIGSFGDLWKFVP